MKRLALIAVFLLLSTLAVSTPIHAASAGCAALNFTIIDGSTSRPSMHFDAGDRIVYNLTSTAAPIAWMTLGGSVNITINPGGMTGTINYTIPTSGNYQFNFFWMLTHGGPGIITMTVSCGAGASSSTGPAVTSLDFTDGRINSHDGAETAAAYCEQDGGVTVYAVADSVGTLAFKVTKAELDAVPAKPDHNILIKSGLGVSLYRLTSGELQINAPDNYVFTWDGCAAP